MKLGETRVRARLHGTKGYRDLEMLVDTGATYTKIPESLAKELGIVPDEVVRVKLGDGSLRDASLGDARIEYGASKRAITVLIGPGDEVLFGVTALEALRLKVNPMTGKLEPFTPYLLGASS